MIEIKKINTPLESMQEEIRIYKKNEQSIYDTLALYQYIMECQAKYVSIDNNIVGVTLIDKVISNFEDPEVNVRYRFRNIKEITDIINNSFYDIFKKYDNYECLSLRNEFKPSYKENVIFKSPFYSNKDKEIDLIKLLTKSMDTYALINEFLASDIPFDIKLEMFGDILTYQETNFHFVLNSDCTVGRTSSTRLKESKEELVKAFQDGRCKSHNISELFYRLLGENKIDTINYLQDNPFDFNQIYVDIPDYISKSISKLSAVALLASKTSYAMDIKKFYQSKNYLKLPRDIKDNNDLYILNQLKTTDELCKFIMFSNFEITEEKVKVLARRYIEFQKEDGFSYYINSRNRAKNIIIRKAKNKEEYKELSKFADMFMEKSDYNVMIKKEKEDKNKLMVARVELYKRLYNMNESLQEQVPGKKYIKDLKFKKNK